MRAALLGVVMLSLPGLALARPESWKAIKSTGGVTLGAPFHSTDGWLLAVHARLSKLGPPVSQTVPDGGLSCVQVAAAVEAGSIYLTIMSGEPRGPIGAVCPSAKLGELDSGTYRVFYRAPGEPPVLLKEIRLER